ncbi:hypothetical protein [Roseinatronobacter sp.]|uniref:hypothetical protein n=1 Tax=Roseinatronobacter sp. TaxID=1945755 RepID=UPI0025DE0A90|nr:hypothetical protein [Roseibaca sp.]
MSFLNLRSNKSRIIVTRIYFGIVASITILHASVSVASVERFDGDYSYSETPPNKCVITGADVENAGFRISGGTYFGIELTCQLTNPVNIRGMNAILFDLQCQGEGMEWEERILLQILRDGRLLKAYENWASIHHPCP